MCVLVMFLVSLLFGLVACKIGLGFCSESGLKVLNATLAAFNVGRWVPSVQRPRLVLHA